MQSSTAENAGPGNNQWPIALRNFCTGLFLIGLPILAYLWLSVDMTYGGSWAAVGTGQRLGAIVVPLLFGILSARFGQRVTQVLSQIVESVYLPF